MISHWTHLKFEKVQHGRSTGSSDGCDEGLGWPRPEWPRDETLRAKLDPRP